MASDATTLIFVVAVAVFVVLVATDQLYNDGQTWRFGSFNAKVGQPFSFTASVGVPDNSVSCREVVLDNSGVQVSVGEPLPISAPGLSNIVIEKTVSFTPSKQGGYAVGVACVDANGKILAQQLVKVEAR